MNKVDNQYVNEMVSFRRNFHEKPETGWTEFRTTAIIVNRLKELGFKVLEGKEVINPDFVMGRYDDEVKLGVKRALEAGVKQEDIDAMEGMIVRAPANATRIRMEIRTYSGTPITGEGLFGLYVDEISVERVR